LIGSTIIASSISNSTINVNNITAQNINYSTLTGSTLIAQAVNYSTLTGSTINANTISIASMITTSSILASGNVGIGTTNPQYHLDVAGTVRNSVNMFADNSAMVSATPSLDYTTFGQNWTTNSLPASGYAGCAMSANGQYQVATLTSGGIYYSSNYGQTWTLSISGVVFFGIALSASGQYGAACTNGSPFNIYISSNYGQTWTSTGQALAGTNGRIAISASGQYITALPRTTGFIYRSSNYGLSWTTAGSSLTWFSVAMSASGQYQVAGTNQASQSSYYSSNYGQTWIASTGAPSSQELWTLTMSASGQYACLATISSGMYYSSNYGQTWAAASGATSVMTVVAMSASGQYAICASANTNPNYIYYSTNYGQTWTASSYSSTSGQNWYGCAISANGQYLLVVNASTINAVQSITRFPSMSVTGPLDIYGSMRLNRGNPFYSTSASAATYTGGTWYTFIAPGALPDQYSPLTNASMLVTLRFTGTSGPWALGTSFLYINIAGNDTVTNGQSGAAVPTALNTGVTTDYQLFIRCITGSAGVGSGIQFKCNNTISSFTMSANIFIISY